MDGEKYAETGVFGAGVRGMRVMRRFHWRGAVALNGIGRVLCTRVRKL